jgi:hypothetical protein
MPLTAAAAPAATYIAQFKRCIGMEISFIKMDAVA